MFSNYKNKSFLNRLKDKWQRRNAGNLFLLITNYYNYFKIKILYGNKFKRSHLIFQMRKN